MPINSKGFTPVIILFVIVILGALGFVGYLSFKSFFPSQQPSSAGLLFPAPKEVPSTLESGTPISTASPSISPPSSGSCNKECQAYIDSKVNQAKSEIVNSIQTQLNKNQPISLQTTTTNSSTNQPKEVYIPFGSGGSTQSTSWTDASGTEITFSPDNYPGAKSFYFQASLVSDAPDRQSYARVYDITNSNPVVGSEISFAGLTSTFKESGAMNFQSGVAKLRVQIHGLNGNIATVQNPRIKVVY